MNDNSIKLSFIVPVYNVEKYLDYCINSILKQMTDECEIVLVDDGSTDHSGDICDYYGKKERKIKVIHQKNAGLACARNVGIKNTKGMYIAFVDSDDYIAENSIPYIIDWIKKGGSEICFMRALKVFPNGKTEPLEDEIIAGKLQGRKEETIRYLSERAKYPGSPCTKIFSRSLIERENIRFPEDGRLSEDLGFVLQCILRANTYDSLPIDYYYYRQAREGSITNVVTYKSFLGLQIFVREMSNLLLHDGKINGKIEKYAMSFIAYEYSIMIWQYGCIERQWKREAQNFLNQYRWVMDYGNSPKVKLINKILKCIGIKRTSRLLGLYMNLRNMKKR